MIQSLPSASRQICLKSSDDGQAQPRDVFFAKKKELCGCKAQFDIAIGKPTPRRVERLSAGLALMYGAGLLSAPLGIGSGVLKIPAMDTALRSPINVLPCGPCHVAKERARGTCRS